MIIESATFSSRKHPFLRMHFRSNAMGGFFLRYCIRVDVWVSRATLDKGTMRF